MRDPSRPLHTLCRAETDFDNISSRELKSASERQSELRPKPEAVRHAILLSALDVENQEIMRTNNCSYYNSIRAWKTFNVLASRVHIYKMLIFLSFTVCSHVEFVCHMSLIS